MAHNGRDSNSSSTHRIVPLPPTAGRNQAPAMLPTPYPPSRTVVPNRTTINRGAHNTGNIAGWDVITLTNPRPGTERNCNNYTETPLKRSEKNNNTSPGGDNILVPVHTPSRERHQLVFTNDQISVNRTLEQSLLGGGTIPKNRSSTRRVTSFKSEQSITKQPCTFVKEKADLEKPENNQDSIICRECKRCKCEACRNPKHLPSKWLCDGRFLCSGETVVDFCSCMCCIKGTFYHCTKDYDLDSDVTCADKPCSCSPHRRILRWASISAMSVVLPCLCLYWPLWVCLKSADSCYKKCRSNGCRCSRDNDNQKKELVTSKRLLDPNLDS